MEDFIGVDTMEKVILAVDDEPFNLDLLEFVFSECNDVEFLKASNGQKRL